MITRKLIMVFISCVCINMVFVSCSGYRFKGHDNPFLQYNIKSISIPEFVNHSSLPNVAGVFTKEIANSLTSFNGLEIFTGAGRNTDAVLIGIISSADTKAKTVVRSSEVEISAGPNGWRTFPSLGQRRSFWIPRIGDIKLSIRFVLIQNPTHKEVKLIMSPLGKLMYQHPKVIFDESVSLTGRMTMEIFDNSSPDSGGVVNFVQNLGAQKKVVKSMAVDSVRWFKEAIVYAF